MARTLDRSLTGATVLITRPVGQGRTLARQVRACGGHALLLPGVSLRADPAATPAQVRQALTSKLAIFTSPAAARFAAALAPLRGCMAAAVGTGTARVLARRGVKQVVVPEISHDSEGLLAHPALRQVAGCRVALIGAPGGRGLLASALRERGAEVRELHVYRRVPARLDRRHRQALRCLRGRAYLLASSAQTLQWLRAGLGEEDWARVLAADAVVSSTRIAAAARAAGFARVQVAGSASGSALLARTLALHRA